MNGKNILHQLITCTGIKMMSYVIETADDKIIVIDGGYMEIPTIWPSLSARSPAAPCGWTPGFSPTPTTTTSTPSSA